MGSCIGPEEHSVVKPINMQETTPTKARYLEGLNSQ